MNSLSFTKLPQLDYAATEAINTLCTNLTFTGYHYRKIMVTSVNSSEGKSFLSLQMMRTLSELGKLVVLIDADLRRSAMNTRYRIRYNGEDNPGITHFLAGKCEIEDVLYNTDFKRAFFVPVGYAVSNSLALLNSPRLHDMIDQLAKQVDYVLIDTPPIGAIADASEIAKSVDGTIFAVRYNEVRRRELVEARRQIEKAGSTVLGAVLNDVPASAYNPGKYMGSTYYSKEYNTFADGEKTGADV